MTVISIREFSLICCADNNHIPEYTHPIPPSAFHWLKQQTLQQPQGKARFLSLTSKYGVECLQVRNYVGIVETPCGTSIEILPKITDTHRATAIKEVRHILWKMLTVVFKLPLLPTQRASLQTSNKPLLELLISHFLQQASQLLHRGLRADYQRVNGQARFIKGRLQIAQQLRQPIAKQHYFWLEYDVFSTNRAENRLLKSALRKVVNGSRDADNQRLARELLFLLDAIPDSTNIAADMAQWREQRDMVHYQALKPWIQLLLTHQSPWFLAGEWQGISMLFAMERLFERYVAYRLREQLADGLQLVEQASQYSLVTHNGKKMFTLKPDLLIRQGEQTITLLDAKWKRINVSNGNKKYTLNHTDMYQMFAYGHKYLQGQGDIYLIFPRQLGLPQALPKFDFGAGLSLWVVPFDLKEDCLVGGEGGDLTQILKTAGMNQPHC